VAVAANPEPQHVCTLLHSVGAVILALGRHACGPFLQGFDPAGQLLFFEQMNRPRCHGLRPRLFLQQGNLLRSHICTKGNKAPGVSKKAAPCS
jgi:hypothetical protein